ncbi:hypothetical protein C5167_032053 [Papaver somniferum]|uniref:DUF4201 domain-containing protein n=1 Tax=Papaver somniferum TaxID=3469 RepID=A0A4Y7K9H9_PAPSO|nr:proton pump-interactor 1-like [Papaver somniferum]RZC68982.1 hypothetical protein C5167_032053 [Papaver somniferum]
MEVVVTDFESVPAEKGITTDGILSNQSLEMDELINFDPHIVGEFVDDSPKPKQFNFLKNRVYENPELDAEIDRTEKEIRAMDETCVKIARSIKEKKLVLPSLRWQLARQNETYEKFMNEKHKHKIDDQQKSLLQFQKNKVDGLQNAIYKPQSRFYSTPEKDTDDLCSSEKNLNDRIRSLHIRLLCRRNKFAEEKQLLGEIKQLEATREKVIAKDSMKEQYIISLKEHSCRNEDYGLRWELGRKKFRYQITLKEMNLVRLKREKRSMKEKISELERKLGHLHHGILPLESKLETILGTMEAEQKRLKELKRERNKRIRFGSVQCEKDGTNLKRG